MGLYQISKLLHSKGNNQWSQETSDRMGENISSCFSGLQCTEHIKHSKKKNNTINPVMKQFTKEKIQMANKYVKSCSMSLSSGKMQIKPTMKYHFSPVRMATNWKSREQQILPRICRKGNLIWINISATTIGNFMEIFLKVKHWAEWCGIMN